MVYTEAAVDVDTMRLRATYFTSTAIPSLGRNPQTVRAPTLDDAERAFGQIRLLTLYATLLSPRVVDLRSARKIYALPGTSSARVVDTSVGSLNIVIELSPELAAVGPVGLLTLAYGICTIGPRISAKRQTALLDAYKARTERERLELEAGAGPLAALLRDAGPNRHALERGPDHIDIFDQEDDELVEWEPPDPHDP